MFTTHHHDIRWCSSVSLADKLLSCLECLWVLRWKGVESVRTHGVWNRWNGGWFEKIQPYLQWFYNKSVNWGYYFKDTKKQVLCPFLSIFGSIILPLILHNFLYVDLYIRYIQVKQSFNALHNKTGIFKNFLT